MNRPVDISIVTPSLRQLQWLQLCAASVADQENVLHEHIVQDAGTGDLVEQWARGIPNLTLYVEQDAGMYDAVNRGLRRAQGEICAYLNCDEQLLPGALARVSSFFDTHPEIDVLFGDAILVDERGNPISYRRTVLPTLLHLRQAHLNTPTCSTFFRRKLLDRGFLFDPKWKTIGDLVWIGRAHSTGLGNDRFYFSNPGQYPVRLGVRATRFVGTISNVQSHPLAVAHQTFDAFGDSLHHERD